MPTVYKTNKGHALTPNNASQVTISDSLYNFIQAQNQNIVTFETINQTYNPKILKTFLTTSEQNTLSTVKWLTFSNNNFKKIMKNAKNLA